VLTVVWGGADDADDLIALTTGPEGENTDTRRGKYRYPHAILQVTVPGSTPTRPAKELTKP
jgi:hypothetical protein